MSVKINNLSSTDSPVGGDLLPVFSLANSDTRKLSLTNLLAWMQANLTITAGFGAYATQYAAPSGTGFSVSLTDGVNDNTNIHLILTPVAGYAAGTLVLPLASGCVDKQEILVNCTQVITALTIDGNGAGGVTGAPTTIAANDFFRLKFDLATLVWYRVG